MKIKMCARTTAAIMVLSLLLTVIPLLGIQSVQSQAPLPGTVSYWMFDEGIDVIAHDSVDANDGTLMNGVEWTTGVSGSALSFRHRSEDGIFEHVLVPDASNLNLVNEATVEFWIKPTAEAEIYPGLIFGKGTFDVPPGWWGTNIDMAYGGWGITTQLQYHGEPYDSELYFTPGILQVDEWQYIAWIFDRGNVRVYRNGQLYNNIIKEGIGKDRDYLPDVTGLPFMFGFTEDWHASCFDLDEFAIYNRALTAEEIQQRYESFLSPNVEVQHRSAYLYEASIFEDWVPNELLNGIPWRNFHIRPQDGVVADARIEMITPWPPETFPAIDYYPPEANFIVEGPEGGLYTYLWEFGSIPSPEEAAVWPLRTNIPVEFQPGFACQRIWNPWISAHTVTQRLTVIFEPSVLGGVHMQVRAKSTPEASITIVEESSSLSPALLHEEYWLDEENRKVVAVNWAGDCEIETYILTLDITIVNEFFPAPIFYKPSVGIGLGLDPTEPQIEITPDYVTVEDDIDDDGTAESIITYSGTGSYNWQVIVRRENSVQLPSYSSRLPFMAPLSVKLSGEFDYLEEEKVKMRVAALVTDAQTGKPLPDADVTLNIYDETGTPVVSDYSMAEKVAGTGIYEWLSRDTLKEMAKDKEFLKGVYLVHVQASLHGGPVASDITQIHIDPPAEDLLPVAILIVTIMALVSSIVTPVILFKRYTKQRAHRAQAQP